MTDAQVVLWDVLNTSVGLLRNYRFAWGGIKWDFQGILIEGRVAGVVRMR